MTTLRRISMFFCTAVAVALLAVACGGSDDGASNDENSDTANDDQTERVETLWVGPQLVDCVGALPQECMQVRQSEDGQVEYLYDQIEGFTHVAGTSYVLTVGVSDVQNPPADASSLRYRLIEVVEESSVAVSDQLDATSWSLIGFRDGDLFDPAPEGIEITIQFDGDQIRGSAACNSYSGSYSADGASLSVSQLSWTEMACEPDVMEQEARFLPILESVENAEVTFDGRLVLSPASGLTLVFLPADS